MVADMHQLPFSNNSFDSVVSLYGPLSYSLCPQELLVEIQRVVNPGGYIALMPYTLRVGNNIEMGGYNTAEEGHIEKEYYTEDQLSKLLADLEDVQIIGVNYFLNSYTRFAESMNSQNGQNLDLFIAFLEQESTFRDLLPAEYARHMIGIGRKASD
jgi:ubiquinone/menaquinone biosynthesis C-methylase UbiE